MKISKTEGTQLEDPPPPSMPSHNIVIDVCLGSAALFRRHWVTFKRYLQQWSPWQRRWFPGDADHLSSLFCYLCFWSSAIVTWSAWRLLNRTHSDAILVIEPPTKRNCRKRTECFSESDPPWLPPLSSGHRRRRTYRFFPTCHVIDWLADVRTARRRNMANGCFRVMDAGCELSETSCDGHERARVCCVRRSMWRK